MQSRIKRFRVIPVSSSESIKKLSELKIEYWHGERRDGW